MIDFKNNILFNKLMAQKKVQNPLFKSNSFIKSHPIPYDSVSFTASAKMPPVDKLCKPDMQLCTDISVCAEPAKYYLESVLKEYLDPITNAQDSDSPIFKFETRIKSPNSIAEKTISKYYKICNNEAEQFAKQVYDGISEYFVKKTPLPKFEIVAQIDKLTKTCGTQGVMTPYKEADYYFEQTKQFFERNKYFDLTKIKDSKLKEDPNLTPDIVLKKIFKNVQETVSKASNDSNIFVSPHEEDGVKYFANDIVGARIIMHESDPKYTNSVIDALIKAVDDGKLVITSIENNLPLQSKLPEGKKISDYEYTSVEKLAELADVSNSKLINIDSKSGYLAIHINLDLAGPLFKKYGSEFNNYSGEIQLIGKNIEEFKQLEDLCYKVKDNKDLPSYYSKFDAHLRKYLNSDKLEEYFDDYTYSAYLRQREKNSKTDDNKFLTLEEANLSDKLPAQLDYNYLSLQKRLGDYFKDKDEKAKQEKLKALMQTPKYAQIDKKIQKIKSDIDFQLGKTETTV